MLDVLSVIMDWAQYVWYLILIIASLITGWKIKTRVKRKMESGFERKVEDWELVSMGQWMSMYDAGDRQAAERKAQD